MWILLWDIVWFSSGRWNLVPQNTLRLQFGGIVKVSVKTEGNWTPQDLLKVELRDIVGFNSG